MIRKAALLAVLSAALLAPMGAVAPGTAAAVVTKQSLGLTVKTVTPELPRDPNAEIKLTGTVRNSTSAPLTNLRVRIRYSSARFTDRAAMKIFQSGQALPLPNISRQFGAFVDIPALEPNASADWQITRTPAQLGLIGFGVYPLTVEVVQDGWQQLAAQHTFITYAPATTPKLPRNRLAVALPLVDAPHRSTDDAFVDNRLAASLKPGGRLADLAEIAKAAPKNVTWFVDPAVFDDVTAMKAPYKVKDKDMPADANAGPWLESMRAALAGVPVTALPYADPDVVALAHQGFDGGVDAAIRAGGAAAVKQIKRDVSTTASWPVGGLLDADGLDLLSVSKVNTVLLNPANVPPQTPATATLDAATTLDSVSGPVTALLPDEELSRTFEVTSAGGSAVLNKQRFIAETAMIAAEPGQLKPRSLVIAPSRRWDPNPELVADLLKTAGRLPWLTSVPLSSIKAPRVQTPRAGLTYTETNRKEELSGKHLEPVKDVSAKAALATQITTDKKAAGFDSAVLRLASAGWRNRTRAGRSATKQVKEKVDKRLALVSIIGADRSLAGADGQVPISVRNKLPESSVTLYVRVTSNNLELLQIEPRYQKKPTLIVIGKTQSGTVPVPMTVKTSGDASVTVQLETADGLPYGDPVKLTIRTTGYTGIALVIVGGALSVMLAAVVTRILRRRSQKRPARGPQTRESEKV